MKILGVDYGKSKVGLAIAESGIPQPFGVIKYKDSRVLLEKILSIVKRENVDVVVVGLPEGNIGKETRVFFEVLSQNLSIPVVYQDETLTTYNARVLSIEAGVKKKKREKLEDAYAACLILENYLENSKR